MRIVERILELVDMKAKSKRDFASMIGIEQTLFNNYMIGKRSGMNFDIVDSILATFPDVSAEWLLRGEGEMYKSETTGTNDPMIIKGESGLTILDMPIETFCNELMANTKMFREQLIRANERIQILKDEVERLQGLREKKRG
jgi:hypothetical protein